MGFSSSCCRICPKNALFKSIYFDGGNNVNNGNSDSNFSGENINFPTDESVNAHNNNIANPRNKNPEKVDWKNNNSEQTNAIYDIESKGIYQSESIGGKK